MIVNAGLRAAQILFSVVVLGLTITLIKSQAPGAAPPSQTTYAAFCGGWGILIALVGLAALFVDSIPALIIAGLDALSVLLILAGSIALAVALGVHSCGDIVYIFTNTIIIGTGNYQDENSLPDFGARCHQAQATTAFLFFAWACFAGTAVLSFMRKDAMSGSIV